MEDRKAENDLPEKDHEKKGTKYVCDEEVSDPELDELLDDALEDFKTTETKLSTGKKESTDGAEASRGAEGSDALFNQIFDSEAQKQWGEMMEALMDPTLKENIGKLAEAAGQAGDSEESKKKLEETLKETLGGLTKNAEDLQSDVPQDELLRLLSDANIGEGDTDLGEDPGDLSFMPMMQGMMKSLLSKDVLYPSLKDISTRYPKWLKENESKEDPEHLANYNKQYEFMKQICEEFEAEKDSDGDTVRKERFEKILDLMQQMQELGYPPKELVGDLPPGFPMGPEGGGLGNLLQNPEQCTVM